MQTQVKIAPMETWCVAVLGGWADSGHSPKLFPGQMATIDTSTMRKCRNCATGNCRLPFEFKIDKETQDRLFKLCGLEGKWLCGCMLEMD